MVASDVMVVLLCWLLVMVALRGTVIALFCCFVGRWRRVHPSTIGMIACAHLEHWEGAVYLLH